MFVNFGVGTVSVTGADGNPVVIAGLQDIDVTLKFNKKKATGAYNFPLAVARGEGEATWKAKTIIVSGATIAALFPGTASATGTVVPVTESIVVPSGSPYTVVLAGAANVDRMLGVLDVAASTYMTKVASSVAAGLYSLDQTTGTLTFAAADEGKTLTATYGKKLTTGHTYTYSAQFMGSGAGVTLDLFSPNPNQIATPMALRFFNTIIDELGLGLKNADFTSTNVSGEAACKSVSDLRIWEFYDPQ